METGIKPGTEKRTYALLASAGAMGFALFAAMGLYNIHLLAGKPNSQTAIKIFWNMGLGAVILAIPMSICGIWLCRRALAIEKLPALYVVLVQGVLAFIMSVAVAAYMLWPK
jgi:hypothetical protein